MLPPVVVPLVQIFQSLYQFFLKLFLGEAFDVLNDLAMAFPSFAFAFQIIRNALKLNFFKELSICSRYRLEEESNFMLAYNQSIFCMGAVAG